MNAAQLHLAINHFPVVLDVVAAVACGWGALRRSRAMQRHGLALAIVAAVAAVPTFLTGEPTAQLLGRDPALHAHDLRAHIAQQAGGQVEQAGTVFVKYGPDIECVGANVA